MNKGAMQSTSMEIFVKGTKSRTSEDSDRNKPVNSLVADYILNHIEHEWVMPNTKPGGKR